MSDQLETPDSPEPKPVLEARYPDGRKSFLAKWATVILCVSLFAVPLIVLGSLRSLKVQSNNFRQWLPSGFEEAQIFDDFVSRFGIDEMVVMSWEDCKIGNPDVQEFRAALESIQYDGRNMFSRVICGPDILEEIQGIGVRRSEAMQRIEGLLLGPDKETTCLVAYPLPKFNEEIAVIDNRKEIIASVYELAQEFDIKPEDFHLGGPTVDGATIQTESKKSLGIFLWSSVALIFLLTWFRMRDLPLSILVIFFAGLGASVSLTVLFLSLIHI